MPICISVFSRALDARKYAAKTVIPYEDELRRRDALNSCAQAVHYIASQGRFRWHAAGHDEDQDEDQGSSAADDDEYQGSFDEEDDPPHRLSRLEGQITSSMTHSRYRGPVFYLLNFACCAFTLCCNLHRDLMPMDVGIKAFAKELIGDLKEFLGTGVSDILADLLSEIIDTVRYESSTDVIDTLWPLFSLQTIRWIREVNPSVVGIPKPGAQGILWKIKPKPWLLDLEKDDQLLGPRPRSDEDQDPSDTDHVVQSRKKRRIASSGRSRLIFSQIEQGTSSTSQGPSSDNNMSE